MASMYTQQMATMYAQQMNMMAQQFASAFPNANSFPMESNSEDENDEYVEKDVEDEDINKNCAQSQQKKTPRRQVKSSQSASSSTSYPKFTCHWPHCGNDKAGNSYYCELHKCALCKEKRTTDSSYCKNHKCHLCNKCRTADSRFCTDHKCLLCKNQRITLSNYCRDHKCDMCKEQRVPGSHFCYAHKCQYCNHRVWKVGANCCAKHHK